jgi:hypothetical protein
MHYYSLIVMSIGAVRMHRGLADGVALCGHQAEIVDSEKQSVKTVIQLTTSSYTSQSEEGTTRGTGGGVFASLHSIIPKVKLFGGKQDDGSLGKETV